MCGRYVITNAVSKTKGIVKAAIKVEDYENYNSHPYQNLPVIKKYTNGANVYFERRFFYLLNFIKLH